MLNIKELTLTSGMSIQVYFKALNSALISPGVGSELDIARSSISSRVLGFQRSARAYIHDRGHRDITHLLGIYLRPPVIAHTWLVKSNLPSNCSWVLMFSHCSFCLKHLLVHWPLPYKDSFWNIRVQELCKLYIDYNVGFTQLLFLLWWKWTKWICILNRCTDTLADVIKSFVSQDVVLCYSEIIAFIAFKTRRELNRYSNNAV